MIRVEKTDCDTRYESQSPLQSYQRSAQIMKHCAPLAYQTDIDRHIAFHIAQRNKQSTTSE